MEMGMRAIEDIEISNDITPPLSPLAYSLNDTLLNTHCSSCFSPLPANLPKNSNHYNYCSELCSSAAASLHSANAELHLLSLSSSLTSTSDLRVALRLLHSLPFNLTTTDRISGLLTNRDKLMKADNDDYEMLRRIREGARMMACARRLRDGEKIENENEKENDDGLVFDEEEAALCLVLTNAVEVQDNEGRNLGIAVYDFRFSFINHSCSPNSCYRFLITTPQSADSSDNDIRLRIRPYSGDDNVEKIEYHCYNSEYDNYGPKIIARSIKRIDANEAVTVAYTDLLQPKAIRQSELWSKYRFDCCCSRCSWSIPSYVDGVLQEICASDRYSSTSCPNQSFSIDETTEKLMDYVDEVITEYLSSNDPGSCCEKLENMLTFGILLDETLETEDRKSYLNVRLHPFHHLALNAYMTLASAHRICGSDLLALHSNIGQPPLEVFDMFRTSAAYSFFLAAVTYHLFCFESSLVASLANFWNSAGESLIMLAKSSVWDSFQQPELDGSEHFSLCKFNCSKCSSMDRFEANLSLGQHLNEDFENISRKFMECISSFSQKVWSFLIHGCHYLKLFKDPMDYRLFCKSFNLSCSDTNFVKNHTELECWTEESISGYKSEQNRINIFQLGVHCLLYGEVLARICYDKHPQRTRNIQSLLYCEEK